MAFPITALPVMSGWPNALRWSKIWKQPAIFSIETVLMTRISSTAWRPDFRCLDVPSSSPISRLSDWWPLPAPEYRRFWLKTSPGIGSISTILTGRRDYASMVEGWSRSLPLPTSEFKQTRCVSRHRRQSTWDRWRDRRDREERQFAPHLECHRTSL